MNCLYTPHSSISFLEKKGESSIIRWQPLGCLLLLTSEAKEIQYLISMLEEGHSKDLTNRENFNL